MRIQYSEMKKLEITVQNDKARDFTQTKVQNYVDDKTSTQPINNNDSLSK